MSVAMAAEAPPLDVEGLGYTCPPPPPPRGGGGGGGPQLSARGATL
jgi:hypothetical protein